MNKEATIRFIEIDYNLYIIIKWIVFSIIFLLFGYYIYLSQTLNIVKKSNTETQEKLYLKYNNSINFKKNTIVNISPDKIRKNLWATYYPL